MKIFEHTLMSPIEREHMKSIDEKILNATPEELEQMQKVDLDNQLNGTTIYDALVNSKSYDHKSITQAQSFKNKNKK